MNYLMIKFVLGWILLFEAAFLLIPIGTAVFYAEQSSLIAFAITLAVCAVVGGLLAIKKPKKTELSSRDGFVIVAFSWIVMSVFGAIPFMLTGVTDNFVDALFETVSGFTTTGATIFSDVEILPRSIIMWRSFTHWIGGMGVLVFIMAFLPLSGAKNMYIMKAESPGPEVSKLVPKVRTTAKWLYSVYIALTVLLFVLLLFGDMTPFEAINAAVATTGTGGFGWKNDSIASYSTYTQIVIAVFMILSAINFTSYFMIIKGNFKEALTTEVKVFLGIVSVSVLSIAFNIRGMFGGFGEALKHSFFNFASLISSTGYAISDFDLWPSFSKTILVLAMFIGACAGSTGGGIKVSRIVIMFKVMGRELVAALRPRQVKKITIDGQAQDKDVVRAVYGYLFCFITVFVASIVIVSFDGRDLVTNFTSVTSAIGNMGPGLSGVGPTMNYGSFSVLSKLVLIFDMLAGRLEFYPILLLLVPSTWRK